MYGVIVIWHHGGSSPSMAWQHRVSGENRMAARNNRMARNNQRRNGGGVSMAYGGRHHIGIK